MIEHGRVSDDIELDMTEAELFARNFLSGYNQQIACPTSESGVSSAASTRSV